MGQPDSNVTTIPVTSGDTPPETNIEPPVELTPEQIEEARQMALLEAIHKDVDAGKNPFEIAVAHGIVDQEKIQEISIRRHYQKGRGSIQDYARIYKLEVQKVLEILDQDEGKTITFLGDLIGIDEAGPTAEMNNGETYKVPYDLS